MGLSCALAEVNAEPLLVNSVGPDYEFVIFLSLLIGRTGIYLTEVTLECGLVPILHFDLCFHLVLPCSTVPSRYHFEYILDQLRLQVVIELCIGHQGWILIDLKQNGFLLITEHDVEP